jgi:hypothetical protein
MRLSSATASLVEFIVSQGNPAHEAQRAADRCVKAIAFSGAGGYYGTDLIALFLNPPAAAVMLGASGAVAVGSMAYQAGFGKSCDEVRKAVFHGNSGIWDKSSLHSK